MVTLNVLLFLVVSYNLCNCSIDINLAQLQYLANHLDISECRMLVTALHYQSYSIPRMANQGNYLKHDASCISLLLHWNSAVHEGLGESHEILAHRLRQIGRRDLADWLGNAVFESLGVELNKSGSNPFDEILNDTSTLLEEVTIQGQETEEESWEFLDITETAVIAFICLTVVVLSRTIYVFVIKRRKKVNKYSERRRTNEQDILMNAYTELEEEAGASGTESETEIFSVK